MSRTNETRHMESHGTCKCKCILDASVCNNNERCNKDKCRCKCKELIDKEICNKGFIWNPSNFEGECDKSCDVGEYLDNRKLENCKFRRTFIYKLVEKCSKNIDGNEIIYTKTFKDYGNVCKSCTIYVIY